MKKLFISIITLGLFFSAQIALCEETIDLEKFAEEYIKALRLAFQQGDFDALESFEDPNVVYHTSGIVGFEAHKQYIINGRKFVTDLQQEWVYVAGDCSLFVLSYKASGIAPDKSKFEIDARMVYRLKDGKVIEVW